MSVFVRDIRVTGSTVFTPEQLKTVTAPYVNHRVTSEDLEALRVALTRLYVERGYVSSGAIVPDQSFANGAITYQIIEGKLSGIDIQGSKRLRQDYYRDRLSRAAGPPLNCSGSRSGCRSCWKIRSSSASMPRSSPTRSRERRAGTFELKSSRRFGSI